MDMHISIPGLELKNPVLPASGTAGYGEELSQFYDLNILGGFTTKSATGKERPGNPLPRIADGYEGTLNCIGLENPGVDIVATKKIPQLRKTYKGPLLVSIAGSDEEEYCHVMEAFNRTEGIDAYEINISCPNVSKGGMALGTDPKAAYDITKKLKALSRHPIYVKLTPNASDVVLVAKAVEEAGADGIVVCNSFQGMRIDLKTRKPILSRTIGGYGGPAILPMALKVVYQCAKEVHVPIIGVGGIASARDVIEFLLAGASAVEVGSVNLKDPYAMKKIVEELPDTMRRYGFDSLGTCIKEALK